jgi:hypothetical protein
MKRCGVVLFIVLAGFSGCSSRQAGPQRFAVAGRVTFDGKPVPAGRIALEPDTAAGNSGPAGYGNIVAGRFTTYPRMGAVSGPQIVRISGFDGIASGEMVEGKELFPEYTTTVELPAKATTIDFDVPRAAATPQKPMPATGKPKRQGATP